MSETSSVVHLDGQRIRVGVAEAFRVGEREQAARVLDDVDRLGLRDLRVTVSWADWCTPEGEAFDDRLLPELSERVRLVACWRPTTKFEDGLAQLEERLRPPRATASADRVTGAPA